MRKNKLSAVFSALLILLTGCGISNDNQQSVTTTAQTEITETVSPADTAMQLPKDKLFSMNIPASDDLNVWYEWRIIGSMEAVDDLSAHLDLPLDELYEWCSDIDFKKEIIYLDSCTSDCVPENAYVYNGMVHFDCPHDMNYGGAIIAAAIPRDELNVLMYETRYGLFESDGIYIFGSPEALEYCTIKFANPYWEYSEIEKYDVNGKRIIEWGKGVDFDKYAIALQVRYFGSSSYSETLKDGVYVQNDEIIFDYEVTSPEVITTDSQTVFCMGIVPKEQLGFLEIEDPLGIQATAEMTHPLCVNLLFRQYGGENIGDLFIGSNYTIDRFESGTGWVTVDCPEPTEQNEAVLAEFGLTEYFQVFDPSVTLAPGRYRIGKPIINRRSNDDYEEMIYYVNFSVTEEEYNEYIKSIK